LVRTGCAQKNAANEKLQFGSPAEGINAAVNWRDFGRSRWQL
jgi:hypothetical protein